MHQREHIMLADRSSRWSYSMSRFEIVAHRGVTTNAPENTLAAFEDAVSLKVDAIEIDVRLTSDGVPIVYHYIYLDAATDARSDFQLHPG
jgi:glycerophosphoryl diester phosphodiesterase